ncbi:MAG: hypothetical protein JOY73_03865 [Actinobacteria bacterium]|nr:hypothetical protein [Actinomycetota bacterium]MBV8234592.1 hypothetical protein [Acidimicrobiia bacterium]
MRTCAAAVAAAAAVFVPAAGAATPVPIAPITPGDEGATTAVSAPAGAAAQPVQLTVTIKTELQCGRIRAGSILVTLPSAMRLGASIPRDSVTLNGAAPASMAVTGHIVALKVAPKPGIICDVIGPGVIRIVFARSAGLGNPMDAGSYAVTVHSGTVSGTAHLSITA